MIVATLVVVTETMGVLDTQVQTRIVRMEHAQAYEGTVHLVKCQPIIHVLVTQERFSWKVRHYVNLDLASFNENHTTQADGTIAVFVLQDCSQQGNKVVFANTFFGFYFDNLSRFTFGYKQITEQSELCGW